MTMQQAGMKGSSGDGVERKRHIDGFRLQGRSPFGPAFDGPDGVKLSLYNVSPGVSLVEALMEMGYLADVIEGLARSIAERVEGDDKVAAQLAYATLRMAEQTAALASSTLNACEVRP